MALASTRNMQPVDLLNLPLFGHITATPVAIPTKFGPQIRRKLLLTEGERCMVQIHYCNKGNVKLPVNFTHTIGKRLFATKDMAFFITKVPIPTTIKNDDCKTFPTMTSREIMKYIHGAFPGYMSDKTYNWLRASIKKHGQTVLDYSKLSLFCQLLVTSVKQMTNDTSMDIKKVAKAIHVGISRVATLLRPLYANRKWLDLTDREIGQAVQPNKFLGRGITAHLNSVSDTIASISSTFQTTLGTFLRRNEALHIENKELKKELSMKAEELSKLQTLFKGSRKRGRGFGSQESNSKCARLHSGRIADA